MADVIYETDENGQQVMVHSLNSNQTAHVRFTNKTNRSVDVWWRNFQGVKVHYNTIKPGSYYDVNTFITHPWEFTDVTTKKNYKVNNKTIFRPPAHIGGKKEVTEFLIESDGPCPEIVDGHVVDSTKPLQWNCWLIIVTIVVAVILSYLVMMLFPSTCNKSNFY